MTQTLTIFNRIQENGTISEPYKYQISFSKFEKKHVFIWLFPYLFIILHRVLLA